MAENLRPTQPSTRVVIEVGSIDGERETVFFVRDNGVGFDVQYPDKLFGVLQRLHNTEEIGSAGIELASVRRIVNRHGGGRVIGGRLRVGRSCLLLLAPAAHGEERWITLAKSCGSRTIRTMSS